MRTQFSKLALTAGISLALAFTFSCSSGGGGGDGSTQLSSSSWGRSSSSSGSSFTLDCAAVPSTGIVGTTIIPPTVTCNGTVVSSGLNWTSAPSWDNPAIGTYSGMSVSASSGNCKGKTATCSGTLTVIPAPSADELTCTGMPTSGIPGTAITPPTVRCGTSTVTTGITWANAPDWNDPDASTYNVSARANCGGSSKTASCGTLTIASVLTCNKVATSGTAGTAITPPAVICNGITIDDELDWFNAPDWDYPIAGTYRGISVSTDYGDCSGITATCSGTLTVSPASSSSSIGSSSSSVPPSSSSSVVSSSSAVSSSSSKPSSSSSVPPSSSSSTLPSSSSIVSSSSAVSSSSSKPSSSSSVPPSSSSSVVSSSSAVSSSSSKPSSSSSVPPSSSSVVPSSSSKPSSSSVGCTAADNTSTQYCSNGTMKNYGSVTYQGETYKTVVIGTQTWFQRNLNYAVAGSKCGNGSSLTDANTTTCNTYGRLYDWATAMGIDAKYNSQLYGGSDVKHKGVCPSGWHLPSDAELDALITAVGGSSTAGTKLKATTGWNSGGNGQDTYGFSALPGGHGDLGVYFLNAGDYGNWW